MPAYKLSFCFAGFTEHGFISCDCAISGGINIAGGLFQRLVTWNGFLGFFPPFSFPFELSPRDRSAPTSCSFNSLAFSSNFLFLSRDMLDWQTKGRKIRDKAWRADRGPRKRGGRRPGCNPEEGMEPLTLCCLRCFRSCCWTCNYSLFPLISSVKIATFRLSAE